MRMPGRVFAIVAAFGLAGLGVTSALAGVHERSEMKALENASVPMNDAASAVEQQTGGVVLSIVFMDDNGTPTYDVESMKNGAMTETKVNAMTGQLTPVGTKQQSELTAAEKAEVAAGKQPMSLQQATTAAEQKAHGKAIQSELITAGGQPAYAIDIVVGDQVSEVVVDPVTGTVVVK